MRGPHIDWYVEDRPRSEDVEVRMARKYGPKASEAVGEALHEQKEGTLRSGSSKKKVTSRKQAIAIGLSEARKKGAKVPSKKSGKPASAKRKTTTAGTKKKKKASRRSPS
jgi:topoisomerase IA-like protein